MELLAEVSYDALTVDAVAARALAAGSRHPLARSLLAASGPVAVADDVVEHPGQGIAAGGVGWAAGRSRRDGMAMPPARNCGCRGPATNRRASALPRRCARTPRRRWKGCDALASRCISCPATTPPPWHRSPPHSASSSWEAGCTPVRKVAAIEALTASGRKVLMVGDGLNDSPSLAAASVSASPASAADISQTVVDMVFQGSLLAPVAAVVETARHARTVMRQNLFLALGYNALMVPLAVAGFVTPWLAAAAMSSSSLLVLANSFRLRRGAA